MSKYIAVDIGGTKILGSLFNEDGKILSRHKVKTGAHRGREAVLQTLYGVIDELFQSDVKSMGVLIPGVVRDGKHVQMCTNVPFENMNLSKLLEDRYQVPVLLGNDVSLAVYGEWRHAGYNEKHVIGVFVGTGLGGGFIFDGKLYTGRGAAAEIGHIPYKDNNILCGCGRIGCAETEAGKIGMLHFIEKEQKRGVSSSLFECISPGQMFHTNDLYDAWKQGDPLAKKVIKRSVRALAVTLGTLNTLLHPELFILGGGVMESFYEDICEELHNKMLSHTMPALSGGVRFVRCCLGDDAGITGAYYLAKEAVDEPRL